MVRIVPMVAQQLDAIARMHITHLRTEYHGFTGKQLLIRYYTALIRTDAACGYVALENEVVAGFICGVWDPAGVRSALLKQHLPGLLLWGTLHSLSRPAAFSHMAKRLQESYSSGERQSKLPRLGYELRPIVVDPTFRGTGVANKLVDHLVRDAKQRGFEHLFLYAEKDNMAANSFYRKFGFEHIANYRVGQTIYLRYEICTNKELS